MPEFGDLGLDATLLRAVAKRGFTQPTLVQEACIRHALEGKDVTARARTGSGKTLAYLLPAVHKLVSTSAELKTAPWQTIVLVPTKELCEQVKAEAEALLAAAGVSCRVTALTAAGAALRDQFIHVGQIVVATPGRIAQALKDGKLRNQTLERSARPPRPGLTTLVVDEADLILSMPGYAQDLQEIAPKVPRGCQVMLMSATTNDSVERLEGLILRDPARLDLRAAPAADAGPVPSASGIAPEVEQFCIRCSKGDRLLHVMALLKLGLVQRKVLLFVNTVEAGFRLRLFLESFGVRSAVVNAELPMNSRHHILQEFNRGIFDHLIATDAPSKAPKQSKPEKRGAKRKRREGDAEFGVTRGVDFKGVQTVLNVEPPTSAAGYVHRVGRTGRAGKSGTAVTLLAPEDGAFEDELADYLTRSSDAPTPAGTEGTSGQQQLAEFPRLSAAIVEALRYRSEDVARALTSKVVREARAKDLRLELINSQRLETHFQEHPGDLALLKHDKALARTPEAPHLKHLPPYLRAAGAIVTAGPGGDLPDGKRRRRSRAADPIKAGFFKRSKRGGATEPLTEMELRAEEYGKKVAKKERKKLGAAAFLPKRNVRKKR